MQGNGNIRLFIKEFATLLLLLAGLYGVVVLMYAIRMGV